MTAEEFEAYYAANSHVTVAELRQFGRIVLPCHCGDKLCKGWQSRSAELARMDLCDGVANFTQADFDEAIARHAKPHEVL